MKGWFDAFRSDGGPTLYSYSNRTPVTGDVPLVIVFVIFGTLFTAFLVIFPGVRKEVSSFPTPPLRVSRPFVTDGFKVNYTRVLACSGRVKPGVSPAAAVNHISHGYPEPLLAQYGSSWHTSSATIVSSYSAFSRHKATADIGGYIGLMHINITYRLSPGSEQTSGDVEYNERFWWRSAGEMTSAFKQALYQGAPFPIVSLAEYFSLHQEGFSWGSRYREAGYYASIMLWTSFASWLMMNLLLMVVPRYGAYGMIFTGLCMLLTNLIYTALLPCEPLIAHIEGSILSFNLGWNYWLKYLAFQTIKNT
ncbi:DUOXA-like protein C06E1.3 [Temnothorax longispinosus]|uniref:DUOXA-like protein C06E1.3 n=1 Tax=Temnothorax longispinosus TaxID=300112 RepID=A0A4S2KJ79_9HYME|nr:DUOXA-like protein C06E1.3 [Temnothorax longispinosus]